MATSNINIENKLIDLFESGTTEEEVLKAYRSLKKKKEQDAAKKTAIVNKREEVIAKVLDYVSLITDQQPTKEEEKKLREYIQDILINCEDVITRKSAEPEEKIVKRGWRNGKRMSDEEVDKIFDKFFKGVF